MEFKLTERDKKLLVVVAGILIIFGFFALVILPAINKREELAMQIEEEQATQDAMAMAIASYPARQVEYEDMKTSSVEALKDYYPIMTTQEIDREITGIVVSLNGEAVNLNIQINEESPELEAYYAALGGAQGAMEQIAGAQGTEAESAVDINDTSSADGASGENASEQAEAEAASASTLRSASVGLTVQADRATLETVVDYFFQKCSGIRIRSYAYSESDSRDEEKKIPSVYIDMELYMCDKES